MASTRKTPGSRRIATRKSNRPRTWTGGRSSTPTSRRRAAGGVGAARRLERLARVPEEAARHLPGRRRPAGGRGTDSSRVRVVRETASERRLGLKWAREGTPGLRQLVGRVVKPSGRRKGAMSAGRQGSSRSRHKYKTGGAWEKNRRPEPHDRGGSRRSAMSGRTTRAR